MANDNNIHQLHGGKSIEGSTLKSGGGDGTFDGMEARVARLEAGMETVQRDVSDLRGDMKDVRDRLKAVEVKVDHLPSKGYIATTVLLALTVLAAMFAFQGQIQAFIGTAPTP